MDDVASATTPTLSMQHFGPAPAATHIGLYAPVAIPIMRDFYTLATYIPMI